ncbi:MAG: hypothetical protein LBL72_05695 [Candidatus Accumulibacter sp.]|jgi:hypothetical protein|nr:hypothetical protein [Accumulibacter sp.]
MVGKPNTGLSDNGGIRSLRSACDATQIPDEPDDVPVRPAVARRHPISPKTVSFTPTRFRAGPKGSPEDTLTTADLFYTEGWNGKFWNHAEDFVRDDFRFSGNERRRVRDFPLIQKIRDRL